MEEQFYTPEAIQYFNNAHMLRGKFLNEYTFLEKAIEFCLISHFISDKDKQLMFVEIVLDRMTFEAKRTALKALLDRKATDNGFIKTKNNKYPFGKLFDEIRILNDQRNCFAHYHLVLPPIDSQENYVIGLSQYRDKLNYLLYTQELFDKWIVRIKNAESDLSDILRSF